MLLQQLYSCNFDTLESGDDIWTQGFGKEDFSTGKAVDEDSLFGVGSITKAFTATLLGILMSEKK